MLEIKTSVFGFELKKHGARAVPHCTLFHISEDGKEHKKLSH